MRGRVLVMAGLLAAGLLLAVAGHLRAAAGLDAAAGLFLLASFLAGLSLLPFWSRLRGPPMPNLFQRPGAGQRWCSACGCPAPRGLCPRCRT
ncbi:MAG TPA: hypothetical protein VHI93_05345, partial [Candidatus Thermoplasmatota archaeon]|nr:hypothetical protein [Candidatus Thermoplasmatota archaeon]